MSETESNGPARTIAQCRHCDKHVYLPQPLGSCPPDRRPAWHHIESGVAECSPSKVHSAVATPRKQQ